MSGPTIVVKFGESVADPGSFFLVELDDILNIDTNGETKNQFYPGERLWFLLHYDPSLLKVIDIRTTSGQVVQQGMVNREHTEELLFEAASESVELSHLPSTALTAQWFGRQSSLTRSGRSVTAIDTPCIGAINYQFAANLCMYLPPELALPPDEEFPVAIVIFVEAAS